VDFLLVFIELCSLGVTAESLRANRDRKSAISLQRGHFDPKFQVQGVAPTNHFCTDSYPNECLTTLSLTVFTQRNFVADFLQAKCDFTPKFWAPFGRGSTYNAHLRLIGKRIVDFLLVLIELVFAMLRLEALRANIGLKSAILHQRGLVQSKISGRRGRPHQPYFFAKNALSDLSCGIKIWTDLPSVLSKSTRLTDGQTASAFHAARYNNCLLNYGDTPRWLYWVHHKFRSFVFISRL